MWKRTRPTGVSIAVLLTLVGTACGEDIKSGTMVFFDPDLHPRDTAAETWLAFPFPSDHRRREDGRLDFSDFPNPHKEQMLITYLDHITQSASGFSVAAPAQVAFDGPIDPDSIPEDMGAFVSNTAPLQIVDITEGSPDYGKRWPLRWTYFDSAGNYVTDSQLAVAPAWGFPLREGTTYALIVTNQVRDARGKRLVAPALLSLLLANEKSVPKDQVAESVKAETLTRLWGIFAPLRSLLRDEGPNPDQVVAATVFTTLSVTRDLAAIYRQINFDLAAPAAQPDGWQEMDGPGQYYREASYEWTYTGDVAEYYVMEGRFSSPNYQLGTVPYATEGGQLNIVDGTPQPAYFEDLRFMLSVPQTPPRDGPCYPIVEYMHGTGGSAESFLDNHTAGRLAARGLAVIGLDQPIHGLRYSGDSSYYTVNPFNPATGQNVIRQSAADVFSLTRMLLSSFAVPADKSPTGEAICFDPNRILYFGHSQGASTGSLAIAFERKIQAWMLSGAGGAMTLQMIDRTDPQTSAARQIIIGEFLKPAVGETVTDDHPFGTMLQLLLDITDATNYGPDWLLDSTYGRPQHVLVTSGTEDTMVVRRSANSLVVAAHVPVVEPLVMPIPGYAVAGVPTETAPVEINTHGITAGFLQWVDDHWPAFHRPEAINASVRFLESAAFEDHPVIERDPDANVK